MAAPVVQSLEQILADLEPAYATQRSLYGTQQAGLGEKYAGQIAGLETRKTNQFRDINRGANAKGLAFSGMPIEEQTRYVGEQYLPGLTNLQAQQNTEGMQLQMALAQLDSEKRLRGLDTRTGQEKSFQAWQEAEADRAFRERMQREQIAAENARAAANRAASSINPGAEFLAYIGQQFKNSGGQGNKNITRQQQDAWANAWFARMGVKDPKDRQFYWDQLNSTYNRTADPTKDWRYKR